MKKSSWIALGLIILLSALLGVNFVLSRPAPETLTRTDIEKMIGALQAATERKDVGAIMSSIAPQPDGKFADLNADQLRLMLARAFRSSGKLSPEVSNMTVENGGGSSVTVVAFDLVIKHAEGGMISENYRGRVTLQLRRVETPVLLGIIRRLDWRIVKADTTGPSPATFGE